MTMELRSEADRFAVPMSTAHVYCPCVLPMCTAHVYCPCVLPMRPSRQLMVDGHSSDSKIILLACSQPLA